MKEFNLELAKAGYPVQTRDGRPVRIICFDRKNALYPILALIDLGSYEDYVSYNLNGCVRNCGVENNSDLVMAPVKITKWVNVYKHGDSCSMGSHIPYDSEEEAIKQGKQSNYYIATVKIEWEE